jgi:hypothetical protein
MGFALVVFDQDSCCLICGGRLVQAPEFYLKGSTGKLCDWPHSNPLLPDFCSEHIPFFRFWPANLEMHARK